MPRPLGPTFIGTMNGAAVAGLFNLGLAWVASTAGVPLEGAVGGPGSPVEPIPLAAPFFASVVPALPAFLVWAALDRTTRHADAVFLGVGVTFAVVSLYPALTLEGAGLSTRLLLAAMHVPAAAGILVGCLRAARA